MSKNSSDANPPIIQQFQGSHGPPITIARPMTTSQPETPTTVPDLVRYGLIAAAFVLIGLGLAVLFDLHRSIP